MLIIIGGDAAGMSAAGRYKRENPDGELIVLEKTDDVSYSACSMPYNIADPDSVMDSLIVRKAEVFRQQQGIDLRTGHEVTSIDRKNRTVSGQRSDGTSFTLAWDKLLIATGGHAIRPNLPGMDLPGVMVLKTLEDGRRLKAFLAGGTVRSAVIIGMGYIALEMCEALVKRGIRVSMVKKRETFMPWLVPEQSEVILKDLKDRGAEIHTGREILGVEKGTGAALAVRCRDLTLEGDLVLVAMGISPASELAEKAGLKLGPEKSIHIDEYMRTSDPDIYAAGDCADALHMVTGRPVWIPLALTANRGGRFAADSILGKDAPFQGTAGTAVFRVFDLEVARTGLTMEEAREAGFDPVYADIISKSKAHTFPDAAKIHAALIGDRTTGRLLGAQMTGTEGVARRINAPAVALMSGMTVERFYQADTAYAPPFSPVWDPLLMAAGNLLKKLGNAGA